MEVRHYSSGPKLLAAAGEILVAEEAQNSLLLGFAAEDRPFERCERGMVAFSPRGPAGALLQTSINEAIVCADCEAAASSLGRALADAATGSRGVVGIEHTACCAAQAFSDGTGVPARIERRLTLHRLETDPVGGGGRSLRPASEGDEQLLTAWADGFHDDTRTERHARNGEQRVRQGIQSGRLVVLEGAQGPVAAATWGRPTAHTRTITCVYTPPAERGRGHGGAITALLARRLLDQGARDVLIFTDADDPTPNHVYAKVGFRPLAPFTHWRFVWPETAPPLGSL